MKILILNDSHFGVSNGSPVHDAHIRKFFTECFFPYAKKNKIKEIIHLGDIFDNRKAINIDALRSCKEYFFDPALESGMRLTIIVGNHDSYYKNTIKVNSPDVFLKGTYSNIDVISSPEIRSWDGTPIALSPWICEENVEETIRVISSKKAKYCFGHFEIAGFKMYATSESREGLSRDIFHHDVVLSGHYHHKSTQGNIHYMGSQYDLNWNDFGDTKYFHVFDTEDGSITSVENPHRLHVKLDVFDFKTTDVTNKVVQLIVSDDLRKKDMSEITEYIQGQSPASFVIKDNVVYVDDAEADEITKGIREENIEAHDIRSIIGYYARNTTKSVDAEKKDKVLNLLDKLYIAAVNK